MPCGHPESCVNPPDGDPGQTRYCRWCAEVAEARKKALEEAAIRVQTLFTRVTDSDLWAPLGVAIANELRKMGEEKPC